MTLWQPLQDELAQWRDAGRSASLDRKSVV